MDMSVSSFYLFISFISSVSTAWEEMAQVTSRTGVLMYKYTEKDAWCLLTGMLNLEWLSCAHWVSVHFQIIALKSHDHLGDHMILACLSST